MYSTRSIPLTECNTLHHRRLRGSSRRRRPLPSYSSPRRRARDALARYEVRASHRRHGASVAHHRRAALHRQGRRPPPQIALVSHRGKHPREQAHRQGRRKRRGAPPGPRGPGFEGQSQGQGRSRRRIRAPRLRRRQGRAHAALARPVHQDVPEAQDQHL